MQEGDKNSQYFHSLVKQRRKANKIHVLWDDEGVDVTSPDQISATVLNFYTQLLGESGPRMWVESQVLAMGPKVQR